MTLSEDLLYTPSYTEIPLSYARKYAHGGKKGVEKHRRMFKFSLDNGMMSELFLYAFLYLLNFQQYINDTFRLVFKV